MKTYTDTVLGAEVVTRVVETTEDILRFYAWVVDNAARYVAVDTETTGLDIFSPSFRVRMVQFGNPRESWVIPVEGTGFGAVAAKALAALPMTVAHNVPYDATVLDRQGWRHSLWQGRDTAIMAHLVDPRERKDGGVSRRLKDLANHYIDPSLTDGDEALKAWGKANKVSGAELFATAPIDLPELEHYAGLDTIMTAALHDLFIPTIEERGQGHLLSFELAVQNATAAMSNRGVLLDVPYAERLREYLLDREDILLEHLQAIGIDNPNSNRQVVKALLDAGAPLHARTPSGDFSVSKEALEGIDHPAVALVQEHGHVTKFRTSYVESCLAMRDASDRIHASIRSLQARTARMSISSPPLQQLPSGDALIRRMFIADPGNVICSADYSQVELRVLAVLADEKAMREAILGGVDLHDLTAERVGIPRKVAKMTNFLIVYGGGHTKLARSANIPEAEAKKAVQGFHKAYPAVKRFSNRLQERSGHGARPIVTPAGRWLPLDRDRTYAGLNYLIQSTARDLLAEALVELNETPGIAESLLLPIHDEVIFQAPEDEALHIASEVGRIMSTELDGIPIDAEGEVYGPSWGHGYDTDTVPDELKEFF